MMIIPIPNRTDENFPIKFFQIEFYGIYKIYRICRKILLIVLKMKITKIVLYKFYRLCRILFLVILKMNMNRNSFLQIP